MKHKIKKKNRQQMGGRRRPPGPRPLGVCASSAATPARRRGSCRAPLLPPGLPPGPPARPPPRLPPGLPPRPPARPPPPLASGAAAPAWCRRYRPAGRRSRSRGRGGTAGEVERKGMKGRGRGGEGDINERGGDREEIARGSRDSLCSRLV
uniref:Uncharacterized protein n=1 Tax=Oryza sativa subsp. japonica TaxID=39947 RepID=Q6Z4P0_ORYSJ|nr:hypothetical protein [Oryza sativa Japonica Group]